MDLTAQHPPPPTHTKSQKKKWVKRIFIESWDIFLADFNQNQHVNKHLS